MIQLFDNNCPSCVSGVTKVFVEDIEEFSRKYQSIEKDAARIERFMKSKSGEIVTDYYSDDPTLNIVQKVKVDDLGYMMTRKRNTIISVENGYGCPTDYYWGLLVLEIRWLKIGDKYYKLVKPSGKDCSRKLDYDGGTFWRLIEIYGNPFWLTKGMEGKPYTADTADVYKGTCVESYVWQVADIFDTKEALEKDRRLSSERTLSEEQTSRVFADIPGDAG